MAERMELDRLREEPPLLVLDEVHKHRRWKTFLKGFFDSYPDVARVLVTGSARLDLFQAGGESLMGRYFPYRHHPLSVAELLDTSLPDEPPRREPAVIDRDRFEALWRFGGFPEPLLRQDTRFYNRWRRLRSTQLFHEEFRDLTRIQELGQVEMLAELVRRRAGQLVSYSSLAGSIQASVDSVRRWLKALEALYYCFAVRPWYKNISRALRKEPKYFLWDWSQLEEPGARAENLVACALLKAVDFWTDYGFGEYGLHFVRDKQKHEVDFLVSHDGSPWLLVEVKLAASTQLSPNLTYFQAQSGARHALQVAFDAEPIERDCFSATRPMIVPARTFLAQLV
jgi:predicted AAA+ superfamily ATPase